MADDKAALAAAFDFARKLRHPEFRHAVITILGLHSRPVITATLDQHIGELVRAIDRVEDTGPMVLAIADDAAGHGFHLYRLEREIDRG